MSSKSKITMFQNCYRWLLRTILVFHYFLVIAFKLFPHTKKTLQPLKILATGTFYSDHWLVTHLRPMANASNCDHLKMVASVVVPNMNKVSGAYAPVWLTKLFGQVGARLIYFSWLAIKERPDVLVGFHLLVNGLFVVVLAKLIGAKSVYICGGGPREVNRGGIETESRIFKRIGQADFFIEKMLIKAVNEMDLVVSMGASAITYFKEKGVDTTFEIVPGAFDNTIFAPDPDTEKIYDLVLIGRLSEIKRVDRFLKAIKETQKTLPRINAVIVGDGPDKEQLQDLAKELHIEDVIHFAGWQDNVHTWIQKSRCFVLTSDSEGLSQALIQAMMCGLPAITSDVGDLGDLLLDGENGYLVSSLTALDFSMAFNELLSNPSKEIRFSNNAFESTLKFAPKIVEKHWGEILFELSRA